MVPAFGRQDMGPFNGRRVRCFAACSRPRNSPDLGAEDLYDGTMVKVTPRVA